MNSTITRKILSLKNNSNYIYRHKKLNNYDVQNNKNKSGDDLCSEVNKDLYLIASKNSVLHKLQKERENILSEIKMLEQRLIFTSSTPLKEACSELKKKDLDILYRINQYLIAYSK